MKKIGVAAIAVLSVLATNAHALQRGELTYMCYKKGWNLWNGIEGNYEACQVRILEVAGQSFRVEMNEHCIKGPSKGEVFWVDGASRFWTSKRSCENQ